MPFFRPAVWRHW